EVAADLFGSRGYARTSIRDIAAAVGMLPGSIYYHFRSKEELLLAVHAEGVRLIMNAVNNALREAPDDPWARLEAAARAHLKGLLTGGKFSMVVTPEFSRQVEEPLRAQLIDERNRYEQIFRDLIAALPLPDGVSPSILRLSLLGSLNWVPNWYRENGEDPDSIATKIIDMLRRPLDPDMTGAL
ncbi:MAG: TetR/AcrR family transcriptional regulator, partial [Alphaproteobacteria bacterium]